MVRNIRSTNRCAREVSHDVALMRARLCRCARGCVDAREVVSLATIVASFLTTCVIFVLNFAGCVEFRAFLVSCVTNNIWTKCLPYQCDLPGRTTDAGFSANVRGRSFSLRSSEPFLCLQNLPSAERNTTPFRQPTPLRIRF